METIQLKGIDLPISRLCAGGCPAGEYGWGNVDHKEIEAAILRAYELGITLFDTADTYGLGRSEINMGETLHSYRDKIAFATKFGVRIENGKTFYDNSPAYLEQALNASLKRLHTDWIDLYQIHYLDGITPIDTLMEALLKHKKAGKIRAIGVSNVTLQQAKEFLPYADDISTVQEHYSLAHRAEETSILEMKNLLNLSPMTWGSLGQGVLTGKYDANVHFDANDRRSRTIYDNFYGEKLQKNLRIVEAMRPIAQAHNVSVAAVAVRWILDYLPRSIVITGMKNPRQAEGNAEAMSFQLSSAEVDALNVLSKE
ncbi:MAG: aldo/keto reductase [Eubacteriales bacterium]|nr:aldo/keto reductase [Eubacteriales bacterium]